jgi:UDP:flavonoid glycosyltransferase YjiC (YdhE family)
MAERSHDIAVIINDRFKARVQEFGAEYVPIPSVDYLLMNPERLNTQEGPPRSMWDLVNLFIKQMPVRFAVLCRVLRTVNRQYPLRPIVIIVEPGFLGANPLYFNSRLLEDLSVRPKIVGLGISVYQGYSTELAPYGLALPPDGTESGVKRNEALHRLMLQGPLAQPLGIYRNILRELGAVPAQPFLTMPDAVLVCQHRILMLHPPSLDYDISDLPKRFTFVGTLPSSRLPSNMSKPDWWGIVTGGDRKIVMVTQGTVDHEWEHLALPAMEAFANRDDVLVVVILGRQGARLPLGVHVPSNARVVDYLPYNDILPFATVCIMNASWGGMMQAISFGVPMVLAGTTEDKPEAIARASWRGFGVSIRQGKSTAKQIKVAVDKILTDDKYRTVLQTVQQEDASLRTIDLIEAELLDGSIE